MSTPGQKPGHPSDEGLHLLLASADDRQPLLDTGLEPEASWNAPKPTPLPGRAEAPSWERPDAAPNDLPAQRWGVVAPEGDEGDAFLRAIAPLIHHREKQQGAPVMTWRVPPDMSAKAAVDWRNEVYRAEDVPQDDRPKYLLLLGDLHHISIEFQHVLTHSAYVGRLHCSQPSGAPELAGYAAYVDKVLAFEASTDAAEEPDVLLYSALDGSMATTLSHQLLVEPSLNMMEKQWKPKHPAMRLGLLPYDSTGPEGLLRAASEARSGLMLSLSHGLGLPKHGWASVEEQRARQGALKITSDQALTGDLLRNTPFLPGGMWFCVACFGAATPPQSAFRPWLELLSRERAYAGRPEAVLKTLPKPGERPFLAALPQALLANPKGPLAIIGHSDLAWTYGFAKTIDLRTQHSRASRIVSALEVLANGSRAGVALDTLMRHYREVNDGLMADYQARQEALTFGQPDPVEPRSHGWNWMLRNDLRGYILLGDPAARLTLRHAPA